jgi:hypothetical protein
VASKSWMCQRCADADRLGSKRRCAFTSSGRFRNSNWSCETMMALRGAAVFRQRDDLSAGSIAVMPLPDTLDVQGWLILSYYKDRGASPGAVILGDEGERIELTLHRAEKILEVRNG